VQLRAVGALRSREELRECAMRSCSPVIYEPGDSSSVYDRFRSIAGVDDRRHAHA
jgi:hypothetical protein